MILRPPVSTEQMVHSRPFSARPLAISAVANSAGRNIETSTPSKPAALSLGKSGRLERSKLAVQIKVLTPNFIAQVLLLRDCRGRNVSASPDFRYRCDW